MPWLAAELVVQPDVAYRHSQLFEQMKDELQLTVDEWLARHSSVKGRHPHKRFPIENRNGNLRPEQLELLLHLHVIQCVRMIHPNNAAVPEQVTTDAGFER